MNKIFLPTLNSIHLKDFSLYPNGLDYKFKFVKGVNLILGGNGLGKTTFINLIKYGLIGLYKKDLGFIRTYRERSIETRKQLPDDYFRNRMNFEYEKNVNAQIIISFTLQSTTFEVTRNLYEIKLEQVNVSDKNRQYQIQGTVISQKGYERLEENSRKKYLQHNYEKLVAEKANVFSFDDFIFFVNEILTFDENHKTILWDESNENIQERLSSKYFNDPELDNAREEAIRKSKYYDSLARHKSEDIKTINRVIEKIEVSTETDKDIKDSLSSIEDLKIEIEKRRKVAEKIHTERKNLFDDISVLNSERNKLSKSIELIEKELNSEIVKLNDKRWFSINRKYQVYVDNAYTNKLCPMCNQNLLDKDINIFKDSATNCFLCSKPILKESTSSTFLKRIDELQKTAKKYYKNRQEFETEIIKNEERIKSLDGNLSELESLLWEKEKALRELEYFVNEKKPDESFELRAFKKQIDELEIEKIKLQEKSKKEKEKADRINDKMDESNVKITQDLSSSFSEYSQMFLGVKSSLTYDEFGDVKRKRFLPIIDNKIRTDSESLSESQRFFVDHSYRMSLLNLFHQQPTFYICETPDSSLDISYERNAAQVFLKFLKYPNSLIITSNLNYSEFLEYIVDNADRIRCINLFEISQKSPIQSSNTELERILKKIMGKINARRN